MSITRFQVKYFEKFIYNGAGWH